MGDPRRRHNQYKKPVMIWVTSRIEEESSLMKEYGLRRKKELWRTNGLISKFTQKAKSLIGSHSDDAEQQKNYLVSKLQGYSVVSAGSKMEDVLAIKPRDFLERRLQTIVYRKGMAKTMTQSRQFIVHRHIKVGDNVVIAPSFLVKRSDEERITFRDFSSLNDEEHPERVTKKEPAKAVPEAVKEVKTKVKAEPVVKEVKTKEKAEPVVEEVKTKEKAEPVVEEVKTEEKAEPAVEEVKE